jgi:polysaccharide pyruvyl transferase WcaK-like protein
LIRVVIPEPITSLNKGEAAILEGLCEALRISGDFDLTLFSPGEWIDNDRKNYKDICKVTDGTDLFDIANKYRDNPLNRSSLYFFSTWGKLIFYSVLTRVSKGLANILIRDNLFKEFSRSDLILAGHDGMFGYEHFWLVLAARIMGVPIALYGGGNDLHGRSRWKIRKFFNFIASKSLICAVRDINTMDYLIANDVDTNKIKLIPDPAVLLKPCNEERANEILKREAVPNSKEKPLYGLIPVRGGIVFNKSFSFEKNAEKRYQIRVGCWAELLIYLLENTNAHFVFLPHCTGPTENNNDSIMSREIFNSLPWGRERVTLIENEYTAGELKGLMGRFDYVLGERTHGLIGAFSVGTPFLALTVEEDLRMHNIIKNMFKQKTFNMNNPDISELKNLLIEEWNNRNINRENQKKMVEVIRNDSYKAASILKNRIHEVLYKK